MRVSMRVPPFAPVPEVVEFTRRCEAAGLDGIGFVDSQLILRDVFVTLAAAAGATRRISLSPAVTNPWTRHVSVLASAAQALDEIAPDRIEVWMGRGYSSVELVGLKHATVRTMRRTILRLRRLMAGEWDVFPGVHTRMRGTGRHIPIIVAASGPRTLQLAGEVADGVLLSGGNPAAINRGRALVMEGIEKAGRDPSEVRIIYQVSTVIRETREEAYRWVSPQAVQRLNNQEWLTEIGIDGRGIKPPEELRHLYPELAHAEDWDLAMDLAARVPRELIEQIAPHLGLIGTPEDCVARLKALEAAGVDDIFMMTVGTYNFPEAELRAFETKIRPALAARVTT
jgi:5,10-methylenetetrahydromethanopterin reductase